LNQEDIGKIKDNAKEMGIIVLECLHYDIKEE
jgi:hypothetical protein